MKLYSKLLKQLKKMTGFKRFIARLDKFVDAKFAKTSPLSKAWHHPAGPKVGSYCRMLVSEVILRLFRQFFSGHQLGSGP